MHQLPKMIDTYEGDPSRYITVVARNLYFKQAQNENSYQSITDSDYTQPSFQPSADDDERDYDCFERCFSKLTLESRALILEYHERDKMEKIIHRRKMAERLGITQNALAIRIHRLKESLTRCIDECLRGNLTYEIN
jgi:DNA-directed RNA polymerase specialized sigma24 family protein